MVFLYLLILYLHVSNLYFFTFAVFAMFPESGNLKRSKDVAPVTSLYFVSDHLSAFKLSTEPVFDKNNKERHQRENFKWIQVNYFSSEGESEKGKLEYRPKEIPTPEPELEYRPKEMTAPEPELVKQFSEESTHSVPLEAEPCEATGEEITMETITVEPSTKQEYKTHEQKVSLALEAFAEELPVDISESVVPGEITMEIRRADSGEPEKTQIEEQTVEIIPKTFTEQVILPSGESLLPTEIVFDVSTGFISQTTESKVLGQRTVSVIESTGERFLEITDETVKPVGTPDLTSETFMVEMAQTTEVGEQVEVEPEDHVSSEEEFYPAEEEVEPEVQDRETAVASVQPETETVSKVQTSRLVEGTTHEIMERVPDGTYSTEVIVDVKKAEKTKPEETLTKVQTIMIQPEIVREPIVTKPEEGTLTEVIDTETLVEVEKEYQVSELETQVIPEPTTEVKMASEDTTVETKEVSQVTTETIGQYPEETMSPIQIIVDLGQAARQVPTQFTTEEEVEQLEKDFTIERTIKVQEAEQTVGTPLDVAETTYEVPLQTGIIEEPIPEDKEPTIHTTEFAMDVIGHPKTQYPEMTLVIEQDGQLTIETAKTTDEMKTEHVEHLTPTETMLQDQIVEQLPEQPVDILPVEDQIGVVTEATFDVGQADKTVPDMMSVIEKKLDQFKAEMITTHEELVSQQVDQETEVFIDTMPVRVIQQPDEIADHQIPSQFTSEEEVEQVEKDFTTESTVQVQETVQTVGIPMGITETTFEVPVQTEIPQEPIAEDQEPTIHTTEFAMDVIGQPKPEYPEMTLVIEQDGQLTIETAKTKEETRTSVVTEQVEHPTSTETMLQEQIIEQIPEQPVDILPVEDQTGVVTKITFDVGQAEMITRQEQLVSQQVGQESEVFFDAVEIEAPEQPDETLVRDQIDEIQPEQVTDIKPDMTKPEPIQVRKQLTDVQPEFVAPQGEGIEWYSPDITTAVTEVESGKSTFPEMMRVLEQKMDSFKTEFVSAQPDTVIEQDSKLTEIVFDAGSARTVVPEPTRVEDQAIDAQPESFEEVRKIIEETPDMLEIPTGTVQADITYGQQALVVEQISELEPQRILPTEVPQETPGISEIVVDVDQADRKFPEVTMTLEQMAVQQPEVPGHVEEVIMETTGVMEVPSEITVAAFESPAETHTPMEIDTEAEVLQEVTEVKQEVTTVSETQYIVHTAGRDATLVTQVDEQAKVTDLETTGRVEGISEETTQVSEITFDVSQAEQKYPEMTLVLEQKGDMRSEMVAREITLEQQEVSQVKEVALEVSTAEVEGPKEYQTLEQKVVKQPSEVPLEKTAEEGDVAFESELVVDMQLADITEKRETLTGTLTKEFPFGTTEVAMRPEEVSTQPVGVILDIGKADVIPQTETQTQPVDSPEVKGTAAIQDQIPAQDVSVIFFDAVEDHDLKEADRTDQEAQAPETVSRISPEATEETPVPLEVMEMSETRMQLETEPFEATEAFFREQLSPETIERITPEVTEETPVVLEMEASESHVVLEDQTLESIETTEEAVKDETEVELQVEPADVTDVQVEQEFEEESSSEKVSSQETVIEVSLAESDMTESQTEPMGEYEIPDIVEEAAPAVQECAETMEITEQQVPLQPQIVVDIQQQMSETTEKAISGEEMMPTDQEVVETTEDVTQVGGAEVTVLPQMEIDAQFDKLTPELVEETTSVSQKITETSEIVAEPTSTQVVYEPETRADEQFEQPMTEMLHETVPFDQETAESTEITSEMAEIDMSGQPVMEVDVTFEQPESQEIIQETLPVDQVVVETRDTVSEETRAHIGKQPLSQVTSQADESVPETIGETQTVSIETVEKLTEVESDVEEEFFETLEQLTSQTETQFQEKMQDTTEETKPIEETEVKIFEIPTEDFASGVMEQPESQIEVQKQMPIPEILEETLPVRGDMVETTVTTSEILASAVPEQPETLVDSQVKKELSGILGDVTEVEEGPAEMMEMDARVVEPEISQQPLTETSTQVDQFVIELTKETVPVDDVGLDELEVAKEVQEAEMSVQPEMKTESQVDQIRPETLEETFPQDQEMTATFDVQSDYFQVQMATFETQVETQRDQVVPEIVEETLPEDQEEAAVFDTQPITTTEADTIQQLETQVEPQIEQETSEILKGTFPETPEKITPETKMEYELEEVKKIEAETDVALQKVQLQEERQGTKISKITIIEFLR